MKGPIVYSKPLSNGSCICLRNFHFMSGMHLEGLKSPAGGWPLLEKLIVYNFGLLVEPGLESYSSEWQYAVLTTRLLWSIKK